MAKIEMGNKTKIVATIGPATSSKLSIQNLIENGATVLRFNMAYCTRDYVSSLLFLIHSIDPHVAIWLDVDGPKTRTGSFSEPQVTLQKDSHFIFYFAPVVGDCNGCSLNFPRVLGNIGDKVFISDGLVSLTIVDVNEQGVVCSVDNSGTIQPGMSVDVPFFASNLPTLTQKDKEDLAFAMSCNVDYFSVSSLGHIEDIQEIRLLLGNSRIKLLSKIENGAAIQNFEQILKISDGIVIDRGALGVQVQLQTLPASQKRYL